MKSPASLTAAVAAVAIGWYIACIASSNSPLAALKISRRGGNSLLPVFPILQLLGDSLRIASGRQRVDHQLFGKRREAAAVGDEQKGFHLARREIPNLR